MNYKEGIRPTLVLGRAASIDLISFRSDYRDSPLNLDGAGDRRVTCPGDLVGQGWCVVAARKR